MMKRTSVFSLAGIVLAIACATLTVMGQQAAACSVGLAAYMIAITAVRQESAYWQIYVFLIIALIFGYSLCPNGSRYILTGSVFLPAIVPSYRLIFYEKYSLAGISWFEPVVFLLGLIAYVTGNIYEGSGWISWVFPLPALIFAGLMVHGMWNERGQYSKLEKNMQGAELGQPAPVFTLPDHDGKPVSLSDFKDNRHVLLIFVRGDWCPTCHIMLRCYEKHKEKFAGKNVMLMAIGPDPVGVNRDMVKRLNLEYKLLSDEKNEAARAYGMHILPNNSMTKYGEGIPLPASFLVDKQGNLVYTSDPRRPGEILNPDTIFPVVESLANA